MAGVKVRYLRLGEETSPAIKDLYSNCPHSVFQTIEFNRIVSQVFGTRLSYGMAEEGGEIVGICPVHEVKEHWLSPTLHTSPRMFEVPYGGWVLRDRTREPLFARLLPLRRWQSALYWSLPVIGENGWREGDGVSRFETLVIDLSDQAEGIFSHSIDGKRRNMIRKAERSNVSVTEGRGEDLEIVYNELMVPTNKSAGIPLHPIEYYKALIEKFVEGHAVKLFLAKHGDSLLAAIFVVSNKWFSHYWIGVKSDRTENLGQGELLQWHAIRWAQQQGSKYYDLCGYEPGRLPRIAEFKADFSKHIVPFYLYSKRPLASRIARRIFP
jgi:hypothetical protein